MGLVFRFVLPLFFYFHHAIYLGKQKVMYIKQSDIESMEKTVEFMKENNMIENDVDIQSLILDLE